MLIYCCRGTGAGDGGSFDKLITIVASGCPQQCLDVLLWWYVSWFSQVFLMVDCYFFSYTLLTSPSLVLYPFEAPWNSVWCNESLSPLIHRSVNLVAVNFFFFLKAVACMYVCMNLGFFFTPPLPLLSPFVFLPCCKWQEWSVGDVKSRTE